MGRALAHYIADSGQHYTVYVPSWWLSGPYSYWSSYAGASGPPLPPGLRMRAATLVATDGSGRHRNFPIAADDSGDWEIGKRFYLYNNDATYTIWEQIGKVQESYQPLKYRKHRRRW